ncbi:MAG: hypothetical protein VR74_02270 [Hyphomonas sp. BRH_c22]|nr:MAG: hypothetical protein VR74_02270 [Hyphomonas sp. BRH_c22]
MTAARSDSDEKGSQWSGGFGRGPGRLNQHRPGMAAASLADPAMMGRPEAGLANPRVEPEIAHQFLG